jgi:hypothetical protein
LGGRAGGSSHGPWRKGWSGGADWPGEKIRLAKGIFIHLSHLCFTFLFQKIPFSEIKRKGFWSKRQKWQMEETEANFGGNFATCHSIIANSS